MKQIEPTGLEVIAGHHHDPFSYLGRHVENDQSIVRVFLPDARQVTVLDETGRTSELPLIHSAGLFAGPVEDISDHYKLRCVMTPTRSRSRTPIVFLPSCPMWICI